MGDPISILGTVVGVRIDSLKLSLSFTATLTLYLTKRSCKARFTSSLFELQPRVRESKARLVIRAFKWPFKAKETQNISAKLRGYTRVFHHAMTIHGCELLLKTSSEVNQTLRNSLYSATIAEQNAKNIRLILSIVIALSETTLAIERGVQKLGDESFPK